MRSVFKTRRKLLMALGIVLLGAALVWAAVELAGQVNSMAQDAGANSASLELISIKLIKKPIKTAEQPAAPPCDWAKEREIKKALEANDARYQSLAARAQSEMRASGRVADSTRRQITDLAMKFQRLCENYASMWEACDCITRGSLAREAGMTRVKSAAVLVGRTTKDFLNEMVTAQDRMMEARRLYAQQAVTDRDIGEKDRMDIQRNILPEIHKLVAKLEMYSQEADKLYWEVQRQPAQGGSPSGGHGGGGSGGHGGKRYSPEQKALRAQAAGVSQTGRAMLRNSQELRTDAESLVAGTLPPALGMMAGLRTPFCFIGATEE